MFRTRGTARCQCTFAPAAGSLAHTHTNTRTHRDRQTNTDTRARKPQPDYVVSILVRRMTFPSLFNPRAKGAHFGHDRTEIDATVFNSGSGVIPPDKVSFQEINSFERAPRALL